MIRDEDGNTVKEIKTTCNPAAIYQAISHAETLGEIDWKASQMENPNKDYPQEESLSEAKKKKWMQDVKVKRPGICTGKKFGSQTCPPGSKQYALAKTFKKAAKESEESAQELVDKLLSE